MFERQQHFDAYFLPGPEEDLDVDTGIKLGLRWLLDQPGQPLIVLNKKIVLRNNKVLSTIVDQARIPVVAPPHVHQPSWSSGAVLAPWASERTLLAIDDDLGHQATAVCAIGWAAGSLSPWIAGHGARDLRTPHTAPAQPSLDPVVVLAMEEASALINHNNALVTDAEKAYMVRTLQELARSGHRFDVDDLVAWAMANGFDPREIPRLRDYATRVLAGRSFQLRDTWGPKKGQARDWERKVAAGT